MGLSQVSPGVYSNELDFSLYVPALSTTKVAMIGSAPKGTPEVRTEISTEEQLINTFGVPTVNHEALHAAIQYLRQGNQLSFVRVAGYNEATGEATVRNETDSADAVVFTPTSSGSWVNGGSSGLQVVIEDGSITNTYLVTVKWRGIVVEKYDAVVLTPTTSSDFIETRMENSKYCTAEVQGAETTMDLGTVNFTGGDDGEELLDSDVIGTIVGNTRTGLKLFSDPDLVDINTLCVPGNWHENVVSEMISICESRGDCMAVIDPPFGKSVDEIIDWHNGLGPGIYDPNAALNSSYAALYWPKILVYDAWSDSQIYLAPSGHVTAQFALTDRDFATWFAPAGVRRGSLPSALDVEYSAVLGDRERLYGGRAGTVGVNAVNPIANFAGQGIQIWGQRTLQRTPTSLDRVNVRRMMIYLRKVIATAVRYLVFEPNDDRMWADFRNLTIPFLRRVKDGRGLTDFKVIMDATTNTPEVIARNEAVGRILLKPTLAAEVVTINYALLPQGARFEEFTQTTGE